MFRVIDDDILICFIDCDNPSSLDQVICSLVEACHKKTEFSSVNSA